ncbi:Anoctamin-5 [Trichinella sp. T6]|nr:Anoctamin-5 [Trichinella sp. T6]
MTNNNDPMTMAQCIRCESKFYKLYSEINESQLSEWNKCHMSYEAKSGFSQSYQLEVMMMNNCTNWSVKNNMPIYNNQESGRHRKNNLSHIDQEDYCDSGVHFSDGTCFGDGHRRIDFVFTFKKSSKHHTERRQFFEQNLIAEGFHLEYQELWHHKDYMCFVLVHVPDDVLLRYAEMWKVKLPVPLGEAFLPGQKSTRNTERIKHAIYNHVILNDHWHESDAKHHFLWPYNSEEKECFDLNAESCFLTEAQRQAIIWQVLQGIQNDPKESKRKGIEMLLRIKVYDHAYPLNDGDIIGQNGTEKRKPVRKFLSDNWASHRQMFNKQPLHHIYRYYGHKVSYYFAFMGFYTRMLIPAAIAGIIATLFGLLNMHDNDVADEVCDAENRPGNLTMCPICEPPNCELWEFAEEGCMRTKLSYVMDNEATLLMSCFIIVWEAVLVKLWKRREAALAFEWGTDDLEESDEIIRPDYLVHAHKERLDKVTMEMEPCVSWQVRFGNLSISLSITLLMLVSSSAALVGLSLLRVLLYGEFRKLGGDFKKYSIDFARWTVHGFIFIAVFVYEKIYDLICHRLTTMERPRTEKDYWFSFLWKMFIFELLNEFIPIFYVAFFKELSINTPLDLHGPKELCDPGGCTSEVTELISVLLLARLIVKNVMGSGLVWMRHMLDRCKSIYVHKKTIDNNYPQWRKDFYLEELEYDGVAEEFMEMIIQFAFCTLFVVAFPLAPLLCFINNLIELRMDAKKMVHHRRPVPVRVSGIEIWNTFFEWIVQISVLTNAAFISFSSDLIPKLYYRSKYSPDNTFLGFANFSLSRVFTYEWIKYSEEYLNVTECWYKGYRSRYPPYNVKPQWWEITAVRLTGFTILVCAFYVFTFIVNKAINDRPEWTCTNETRENYNVTAALVPQQMIEALMRAYSEETMTYCLSQIDTYTTLYISKMELLNWSEEVRNNGPLLIFS